MPNRTSPRHPFFDYRTPAAYFVTVCTHNRRPLFGRVVHGRMYLNAIGTIVAEEWRRSEPMRDEVLLDAFVVMPDHLHGIVCLVPPDVDAVSPRGYDLHVDAVGTRGDASSNEAPTDAVGAYGDTSLRTRSNHIRKENGRPQRHARSLGSMIAGFKSAATKRINQHRGTPGAPVWQSRYHDRILRNEREWRACRRYIEQNPSRGHRDRNHSTRPDQT